MKIAFSADHTAPIAVLPAAGFARLTVKPGEAATVAAPPPPHERVVAVGAVGAGTDWRTIGGKVAVELAKLWGGDVAIDLGLDGLAAAEFAYGLLLRSYRPPTRRATPDVDLAPGPDSITIVTAQPQAAEARFARLAVVAQGCALARDLVAEPGNLLGPAEFAARAQSLAASGIAVEVLDPKAEGLDLLAAVGQGSARPPCLVVLRWNGGEQGQAPLVLVGKGITFDAGGISIKPAEHMEAMKGDMAGAAAVLGAIHAIAARRAGVNVVGVLAIAENMPSGAALRPGDVLRSYNGQTVEVVDTDAEGRLVLADALAWACATLSPALVVDAATLTGAVIRILGRHHAGLYTADDALAARLMDLGLAEAEPLWRLPLTDRCDDDLKSDIADLKNCAWGKVPDNDDSARFLQRFVPEGIAWAHLDIAGTSEADEDCPFGPKGPTGFGVRLFDALAGG